MKMKKYVVCLLIGLTFFASTFFASADYYYSNTGYQGSPKLFKVVQQISDFTEIGSLANPSDLFIDENDDLYIVDTGNSRILAYDKNGKFIREYSGTYGKDNLPMQKPLGVFVRGNDIYVADTDNQRVLHLAKDGSYIEEFTQPTEDTYDTEFPFRPNKVVVDDMGIIYIANLTDYHGLITMNGENKFLGYVSSSKIELSFLEKVVRIFATPEAKAQFAKEVPPYFSNIVIGPDRFIYGVSNWAYKDQIKKITPAGNNIYPKGYYGQSNKYDDYKVVPGLGDIAVDSQNFVYVSDTEKMKIAVFDQEGHNIAVFAKGGNVLGKFTSISSIAINSAGNLYVLDGSVGVIQVFQPTDLMKEIGTASYLTTSGQYEAALPHWQKVKEYDDLQYLANLGIAKAEYRSGDFVGALKLYKDQFSREDYSKVFSDYRINFFRAHFLLVCAMILAVLAGVIILVKRSYAYAGKISMQAIPPKRKSDWPMYGRFALLIIFHPTDAFDKIKQNRNRLKIWPIALMVLLLAVTRISNIYIVHFPLSDIGMVHADLWQQVVTFFLPLLSWVIVGYALSVTSEGKQTLLECLTTSSLCFLPYVIFSYPLGLLSHVLSGSEAPLFNAVSIGLIVWSVLLLLASSMRMNEYSFGKVLWMSLKTIFAILCFWMLIFLFGIIVYQFVDFIRSIYVESTLIFM